MNTQDLPKVLHHHIPKTGGTTLNTLLSQTYGDGYGGAKDIFPYIGYLKRQGLSPDYTSVFEKFEAIGEHKYLLHVVPKNWTKVVILRNPIDRVLSLYYDWLSLTPNDINSTGKKSGPDCPRITTAVVKDKFRVQEMPLHEFIQSAISSPAQRNYLSGMCHSLIDVPINCSSVSDKLRQWRKGIDVHIPQELFEAARDQLKLFDYIAFQDDLQGSIDDIFSLLNTPSPEVPRLNNKEGKLAQIKRLGRKVPPIDIDVIKSFQEADYLLYEYAKNTYDFT